MAWLEKRDGTWFIADRDQQGKTNRLRASTDKLVAKGRLADFEKAQARGEDYSDPFKEHRDRPLADHVADWTAELRQIGRDDQYVAPCKARLERLMSECKWAVLGDIDADSFCKWRETAIGNADHNREDKATRTVRTMSPRSKNHYLATLNTFCRWCIKRKRMAANPVADVEKVDESGDMRRERRALTTEELRKLLNAVPAHYRLGYQVLMATGLR